MLRESLVVTAPAVVGGALLALAFPRYDIEGAAWVALAPLIFLGLALAPRAAFGWGWLTGTVFFLALLHWLDFTFRVYSAIPWPLTWGPTFLLAAYCGLYVGLFAAAVAWIGRSRAAEVALVLAPFVWVAGEWIRGRFLGGFPWGSLGYSQYRALPVIQVAEIGGVYAVSFVVLAVNAALAGCALLPWRRALLGLAGAAALIGGTLAWGHARLALPPPSADHAMAVMQPSIEQPLKWDARYAEAVARLYVTLTSEAGRRTAPKPELIVWPETASPTMLRRDPSLLAALAGLSGALGVPLLVGSVDAEGDPPARFRNTAFLLTETGIQGRYDKIHLVPFGEYVPLGSIIGFVRGWAEFIADLEPGSRIVVFPGPPAPFGVVICYEGIFPELFRRFVTGGARVMVNMTNDAWFGRTSGPLQHLAMYPLRAVEHRIAIVRAANTGVSAFIAPSGRIVRRLDLFQRGTLVERVPLRSGETLYTRFGDWLAYLALAVTAGGLAWAATGRRA